MSTCSRARESTDKNTRLRHATYEAFSTRQQLRFWRELLLSPIHANKEVEDHKEVENQQDSVMMDRKFSFTTVATVGRRLHLS